MNQIDKILEEENPATNALMRERDIAERIRNDVRAGRKTEEEGARESAGALKRGLTAMFEEDPLKAAQIVAQTMKDIFRKGFIFGFFVGAVCAFITAYIISS